MLTASDNAFLFCFFPLYSALTEPSVTPSSPEQAVIPQLLGHSSKTSHTVNQNHSHFWLHKQPITAPHLICRLETIPGFCVHYPQPLNQHILPVRAIKRGFINHHFIDQSTDHPAGMEAVNPWSRGALYSNRNVYQHNHRHIILKINFHRDKQILEFNTSWDMKPSTIGCLGPFHGSVNAHFQAFEDIQINKMPYFQGLKSNWTNEQMTKYMLIYIHTWKKHLICY